MKTKPVVIIKLGGSIITYKDSPTPRVRYKTILRLAQDLKELFLQDQYQFLIVHGAGSFGHPLAKKYKIHHGMKTEEQKYYFSVIARQMIELNLLIIKSLQNDHLPSVSIPPHSFIKNSQGKPRRVNFQLIQDLLNQKIIPVLYGDVVLDDEWGCSILSGDKIVADLAKYLKAEKIIFLSDIDGVFDSNPKINPKAKLIPEITNKNVAQVLHNLSVKNQNDVTGEMQGKITAIKKGLLGIPVYIVNGLTPHSLQRVLTKHGFGTRLQF